MATSIFKLAIQRDNQPLEIRNVRYRTPDNALRNAPKKGVRRVFVLRIREEH